MDYIFLPRGAGKTTELVKMALDDDDAIIVVVNEAQRRLVLAAMVQEHKRRWSLLHPKQAGQFDYEGVECEFRPRVLTARNAQAAIAGKPYDHHFLVDNVGAVLSAFLGRNVTAGTDNYVDYLEPVAEVTLPGKMIRG